MGQLMWRCGVAKPRSKEGHAKTNPGAHPAANALLIYFLIYLMFFLTHIFMLGRIPICVKS